VSGIENRGNSEAGIGLSAELSTGFYNSGDNTSGGFNAGKNQSGFGH
jgi:hypothetical protein